MLGTEEFHELHALRLRADEHVHRAFATPVHSRRMRHESAAFPFDVGETALLEDVDAERDTRRDEGLRRRARRKREERRAHGEGFEEVATIHGR